ncbi:hypothetical protein WMY93_026316 [Mugilogobius chulae]|uniref:Dysbindin n=1 Tax=Mugilogobius chulae TaxID=88201 RepID=A0AAW0N1F6_9GOBI
MLSALWDKRRTALTQLEEQLQSLPAFISELDTITSGLALLEGDFEELESRMVYLETLCCQCDQQSVKQQHLKELEGYKKKKRKELHAFELELNQEHAQKVAHMEQKVQHRLKQKQKEYEEAFHQDVEKYLSSGFLTHREAPPPDASDLDHITVTNTSDLQALDDFLNSSTEDLSSPTADSSSRTSPKTSPRTSTRTTSPGTSLGSGSDETWSHDGVCEDQSRAPGPEQQQQQQEEQSSETDSDEPVVELDQEEVLADASL